MKTLLTSALLAASMATAAGAGDLITGAFWRAVDNSTNTVTSQSTGLAGSWLTFDLYITGVAGTVINGINMGYAANPQVDNQFIYLDGTLYQDSFENGYFGPDPADYTSSAALEYDTYFAMDDAPTDSLIAIPNSVDLVGPELRGIWFKNPPMSGPFIRETIDESGEFFIARFTVSSDSVALGGEGSFIQIGIIDEGQPGVPEIYIGAPISNALVPTPGVAGVFALAGVAALRRRR